MQLMIQRSDVYSRDAQGNTALHLAALNGNGWICWRLLEQCSYQLLHELNAERCTPLDLAKRGSASKYVRVSCNVMQCSVNVKFTFYCPHTHTHTHPFNGPLSGTTRVRWYQKGKTNLDFTGARDSEWQWHHLGHMQVCTSLQTDNHASTPPLSFLQAGCPSCRPTNIVKAPFTVQRSHFENICFSATNLISKHYFAVIRLTSRK